MNSSYPKWSGKQDLNLQPLGPNPSALPSWAISRSMVRSKGFEPLTFWFVAKHSIQLSYERSYKGFKIINGGSEWNRTTDTGIFSPLLYRLSYRANNKWRSRRELNSRSSAWQADVITATPRDHLVAEAGFEPTTFGLWAQRATRLLHSAIYNISGGERGIRTPAPFPTSRFSRPVPSTRLGYFSIYSLKYMYLWATYEL